MPATARAGGRARGSRATLRVLDAELGRQGRIALRSGLRPLGIDLPRNRAGRRDDPALFAVASRSARRGHAQWPGCGRVARVASPRCACRESSSARPLIGVLLPGANALLFVAERDVPIGLASLVIASVPLLVVALRFAGGDRPTRGSLIGVAIGFVGIARARPAGRRRDGGRPRPRRRLGGGVGGRLVPLGAAADAAGCVRRHRPRDARRRARPAPDRAARDRLRAVGVVDAVDLRLVVPRRVRLAPRLHRVRLAPAARSDRQGRDVRLREPGGRDHPRRDRPATRRSLAHRRSAPRSSSSRSRRSSGRSPSRPRRRPRRRAQLACPTRSPSPPSAGKRGSSRIEARSSSSRAHSA